MEDKSYPNGYAQQNFQAGNLDMYENTKIYTPRQDIALNYGA